MKTRHGLKWASIVVCGAIALGVGSRPALAQGQNGWEVLVAYSYQPSQPKDLKQIALRPNVAQSVYLYLRNMNLNQQTPVEVRLLRGYTKGNVQQFRKLAEAKLDKVFTQPQLVTFVPAAEPPKKDEAAKAPAPSPDDEHAPFHFQLVITEPGVNPVSFDLPVRIQQPQEYVKAVTAQFDKKKSLLSARVEINADSADPPCHVELVLGPEIVPGGRGLLEDDLNATNREVELRAENVQFVGGLAPPNGRVALNVDHYNRAFMFKTIYDQGDLKLLEQTRIRARAPRYFNPAVEVKAGAKDKIVVLPKITLDIEADGTEAAKFIEVALDRSGEGRFIRQRLLPGLREQAIAFAVGADGNPQFTTLARDWKLDLDPKGVVGRRLVRLQVLDKKEQPLDLADEQNERDEAVFLFFKDMKINPFAPLTYDRVDKAVYVEIVIDPTGPEGVQLVDLPKTIVPGDKIKLKAKTKERDKVEQAPITMVQFFVGDPAKAPGLPAVYDPTSGLWRADLIVPKDVKDKLELAVRATTVTGLSAGDEATMLIEGPVVATVEKSKITGEVKWTDRLQPERPVVLAAGKTVVMKGTTDQKGVYVFQNVPPGKYQVFASVPGIAQGFAPAVVTKDTGETIKADITIKGP